LLDSLTQAKEIRPTAMLLLAVGLILFSCAIGWQHTLSPLLHLSPDLDDFTHGFCMGLAVTLEAIAVLLLVVQIQQRERGNYENRSRSASLGNGQCSSLPRMQYRQRATSR
jgi:hypothetical protein